MIKQYIVAGSICLFILSACSSQRMTAGNNSQGNANSPVTQQSAASSNQADNSTDPKAFLAPPASTTGTFQSSK